jgi:hypothetical protein
MPDATITPLRPRVPGDYSDTAALNDIHALLTAPEPGAGALADIAVILARTGRPMARVRDITVTTVDTALGWPVACTDAGDTTVFVRQAPAGSGLLVEICTKTAAERDALTVTLDGQALCPPGPATGGPA